MQKLTVCTGYIIDTTLYDSSIQYQLSHFPSAPNPQHLIYFPRTLTSA